VKPDCPHQNEIAELLRDSKWSHRGPNAYTGDLEA
jgi:hypothetical protein